MKPREELTEARLKKLLQGPRTIMIMIMDWMEQENIILLVDILAQGNKALANYLGHKIIRALDIQYQLQIDNPEMSSMAMQEIVSSEIYAPLMGQTQEGLQLSPEQENQLEEFWDAYAF